MDFSRYKDIFGEPGTGVHSIRILNVAVVDLIMTVVIALMIARYRSAPFWPTLAVLLVAGVLLHRLFGVKTTLDRALYESYN